MGDKFISSRFLCAPNYLVFFSPSAHNKQNKRIKQCNLQKYSVPAFCTADHKAVPSLSATRVGMFNVLDDFSPGSGGRAGVSSDQ